MATTVLPRPWKHRVRYNPRYNLLKFWYCLQMFYDQLFIAVKEPHVLPVLNDLQQTIANPFNWNLYTKMKPLKIIMQFHGLATDHISAVSLTVLQELNKQQIGLSNTDWSSIWDNCWKP